jgi:hypothetical protein
LPERCASPPASTSSTAGDNAARGQDAAGATGLQLLAIRNWGDFSWFFSDRYGM